MKAAREDANVLGACFMALRGDREESLEEHFDARVGALRLAEFVNMVCGALKKG